MQRTLLGAIRRINRQGFPFSRSMVTVNSTLILSESDVKKVLKPKDCIEVNREAFIALASGQAVVPPRIALAYNSPADDASSKAGSATGSAPNAEDWTLIKPATLHDTETTPTDAGLNTPTTTHMGMKVISLRSQNPALGLPFGPATILLLNAATGMTEAILGGTHLTVARTSAGPALAVQLFRPDVERLVMFGAGAQAECHIRMMQEILGRSIPHITIVNRTLSRANDLKEKLLQGKSDQKGERHEIETVALDDIEGVHKALRQADVVSTATNSTKPLWTVHDESLLKDGCLVTSIGSYTPKMQEIPHEEVSKCHVVMDTADALTVGDLKHLNISESDLERERSRRRQHNTTEGASPLACRSIHIIGDIFMEQQAKMSKGITQHDGVSIIGASSTDRIFYKSVGSAVQDVLTAHMVVDQTRTLNAEHVKNNRDGLVIGHELNLS